MSPSYSAAPQMWGRAAVSVSCDFRCLCFLTGGYTEQQFDAVSYFNTLWVKQFSETVVDGLPNNENNQ